MGTARLYFAGIDSSIPPTAFPTFGHSWAQKTAMANGGAERQG